MVDFPLGQLPLTIHENSHCAICFKSILNSYPNTYVLSVCQGEAIGNALHYLFTSVYFCSLTHFYSRFLANSLGSKTYSEVTLGGFLKTS